MRADLPAYPFQNGADGPDPLLPTVNATQRYYLEMSRRGRVPTPRTRHDEREALSVTRREYFRLHAGGCRCGNPNCGYVFAHDAACAPESVNVRDVA